MKKNIKTTELTVIPYSYDSYGQTIAKPADGCAEFIDNAYSNAIIGRETNGDIMRIAIDIVRKETATFLYIKNSGCTADFAKVLNYGQKNYDTGLNQYGTGFKTAVSFFNPTNDGWKFYTKSGNNTLYISAPYCDLMYVNEYEGWDFEEWAASCIEVRIDDETKLDGITAEEIGFRYAPAIKNDGLNITFNGEIVKPVEPNGCIVSAPSIKDAPSPAGTKVFKINNEDVKITYAVYNLNDDAANDKYYHMGPSGQGVYLFVNHRFAKYLGTQVFPAGSGGLKEHPSMNHLVAVVDIETPRNHKADIPFINNKSEIQWNLDIGKEYRKAIAYVASPFFKVAKSNATEAELRMWLDKHHARVLRGLGHYNVEYRISNMKIDAVIGKEVDKNGKIVPESITTIIEYKRGKVTNGDIGQAIGYFVQLRKYHEVDKKFPQVLILGTSMPAEVQESMDYYNKAMEEVNISFESYPDSIRDILREVETNEE